MSIDKHGRIKVLPTCQPHPCSLTTITTLLLLLSYHTLPPQPPHLSFSTLFSTTMYRAKKKFLYSLKLVVLSLWNAKTWLPSVTDSQTQRQKLRKLCFRFSGVWGMKINNAKHYSKQFADKTPYKMTHNPWHHVVYKIFYIPCKT